MVAAVPNQSTMQQHKKAYDQEYAPIDLCFAHKTTFSAGSIPKYNMLCEKKEVC
jgi:hypothetical protein